LEHFLYFHIYGIILHIDELIFFKMVKATDQYDISVKSPPKVGKYPGNIQIFPTIASTVLLVLYLYHIQLSNDKWRFPKNMGTPSSHPLIADWWFGTWLL